MPLPRPVGTWEIELRENVVAQQASASATANLAMRTLIPDLVTYAGWTVDYSSNGTGGGTGVKGDGINRLVLSTDIVGAANGAAHSWIVMDAGDAGQYLFHWNTAGDHTKVLIYHSVVGFTGGTATNNPSAAGAVVVNTSPTAQQLLSSVNGARTWAIWRRTDAPGTRIAIWGGAAPTGKPTELASFEEPGGAVAAWTTPVLARWRDDIAATGAGAVATWTGATGGWNAYFSGASSIVQANIVTPTSILDLDGDLTLEPTGLHQATLGRIGRVDDWFWVAPSIAALTTISDEDGPRGWIVLGDTVWPWPQIDLGTADVAGAKLIDRYALGAPVEEPEPGPAPTVPFPYDPQTGSIGLVPPATVLLHLTEPDGVQPSDGAGNLDDLAVRTGGIAPASAVAWTGRGRAFGAGAGLVAQDIPGRDTLVNRDATVQVIAAIDRDALSGAGAIYVRGIDGSAAEYYSLGLDVTATDVNAIDVRLFWQDSAGVIRYQSVGTYDHPGDDAFVMITATRRWEATDRAVVRYYLGDMLLAEHVTTHGDIAGGTTGTTSIGARREAGAWGSQFRGTLDELKVTDYEMSPEEIRETWRRLYLHQPAGLDMMRGLIPPGLTWARDPSSRIARLVKIAGQAIGYAVARTEELRATWLPGTAYIGHIVRWERIRGVSPRARDSLDRRRERVVSLFRREHGYSRPAIRLALEDLFDQEADDIVIDEFTNEVADSFATLLESRWQLHPDAADWSILTGTLRAQRDAADDLDAAPSMALMSLSSGEGAIVVAAKVTAIPSWSPGTIVGLVLLRKVNGHTLWYGVRDAGGTYEIVARSYTGAAWTTTMLTTVGGGWTPAAPIWLRVRADADTPGSYVLEYSTTSATAGYVTATVLGRVVAPEWAGVGAWGGDGSAALDARFDDFVARTPQGTRPFAWYAYRDPGLPGEPDMVGARVTIRKLKPAHTHGAAIATRQVLCDDPNTGCDREPMGGD